MEINFEKSNIIFIDGLTLETVRIKYNWLLNANVKDAIIGEDDNGIVWYSGDWLCGVWEDGTWYSGNFHDGIWKKGNFYSYKLNKFDLVNNNFIIRERSNSYSRFLNGVWLDGTFHSGYFGNYNIEDWEDFEITNEKKYLTFKRSTEDVGGEPIYEFKNLATWVNGIFENGIFEHSIWLNGRFINGLMLNSKWINGRWYNGTFDGDAWYNGEWFNGEFIRGKWYNGTFNKIKDDLVSRFGNTLETTDSVSKHICQWFDGVWKNGEFFSGYIEENGEIKESKDHWLSIWYKGTWENGIWYGGHFKGGEWYNGEWKAGIFGDFSIVDWCDPLYVYQDDIINSGITTWENVGLGQEPDITNVSNDVNSFYNNQGEYEFKNYNYTINIDDIQYPIKHGYLYNYHAVSGSTNDSIANVGWRVTSDDDWKELEISIGMDPIDADLFGWRGDNEGSKLAGKPEYWNDGDLINNPDFSITNFDAVGSDLRMNSGVFGSLGQRGVFWCSGGESRLLQFNNTAIYRTLYTSGLHGRSVRLCRDATLEELSFPDGTYCEAYVGNDGKFYKTVKIYDKVWLAENLSETKLRNGIEIPNITDNNAWTQYGSNEQGARCLFNNEEDNLFITDTNTFRVNNNITDNVKRLIGNNYNDIDINFNYDLIDIVDNQTYTLFINDEENMVSGITHMGTSYWEIESENIVLNIENVKFIVKRPIELLPGDGSEMTYWEYDKIVAYNNDPLFIFDTPGVQYQRLLGNTEPNFSYTNGYIEQGTDNDIVLIFLNGQTINVGDSFQGGKIIYMDEDPVDPTRWRGIIAANSDIPLLPPPPQQNDFGFIWGNTISVSTSQELFSGSGNTENIIAAHPGLDNIAAKKCEDYVNNGFNDWFLPSSQELHLIWENQSILNVDPNGFYWSSSQFNTSYAYYIDMSNPSGIPLESNKTQPSFVRPIRYFSVPKEYYVVISKSFTNEDANKSGILARYNTLMNERLSDKFINSSTNPSKNYNIQSRNKLLFQDFNVVYDYVADISNTVIVGIQIEFDVNLIKNNRLEEGFKNNKIFIPLKNLDHPLFDDVDQAYYSDEYRDNPGLPNIIEGKDLTIQIGDKKYILGGIDDMWGAPGLEQYYDFNSNYNITLLETIRDNFRLGFSFNLDCTIDQRIIVKNPRLRAYYSNISERPKWYNGVWYKGIWFDGEFYNGKYISGMWLNGKFINGNLSSDYR